MSIQVAIFHFDKSDKNPDSTGSNVNGVDPMSQQRRVLNFMYVHPGSHFLFRQIW